MTATEFKRTEEDMLNYLDDAAIGLHWVDGNAIILWAKPSDYEPLGYTADERIGHNITEFHAEPDVINDILVRLLSGRDPVQLQGQAPAQRWLHTQRPHHLKRPL
jgi:PAS domain-containing protein